MYNLSPAFPTGLREKGHQKDRLRRAPDSGLKVAYLVADLPLNPGEVQEAPAGGSPPVFFVNTEEGNRLIPKEIRLQEDGTEEDNVQLCSFLSPQPMREHPLPIP